jgi:hypothetical protein
MGTNTFRESWHLQDAQTEKIRDCGSMSFFNLNNFNFIGKSFQMVFLAPHINQILVTTFMHFL